jgi:hypothetical protein
VNWRALGCGTLAVVAFVAIGAFGISRATAPAECPASLPYQPSAYERIGEPASSPRLPADDAALARSGGFSFGLATWDVWVAAGTAPAAGEPLPERIVLDCGNGTFQAYRRGE